MSGSARLPQTSPYPNTPPSTQAPPWEDLHMIQTRAMLELRVCD